MSPVRRRRAIAWLTAVVALVAVGCSGPDDTESTDTDPDASAGEPAVLRYNARTTAPETLDPARAPHWNDLQALAYDKLIYTAPDGTRQPQLAESWQYVGEGNTVFEIALRPDITFDDGTPVDAEAVKANIEYHLDPAVGSQAAPQLATVTEVEIVDELTVRVHLSEPNPLLANVFSGGAGVLISPEALADPQVLATDTFGVGRYRLVPDETVHGDHYTFAPNPEYWNPDDVHWDEVVVSFLPEQSAALAALQSGQIDASMATIDIVQAGRDAGLGATGPGYPIVSGLNLWDRGGAVVPALADERVRQALNFAVDREAIAGALLGETGAPTDQMAAPGRAGWNEDGVYPYDPERAAELLAEAGYADGFTLPVRTFPGEQLTQAVADNLGEIGVELEINADQQMDQADDAGNQAYGAGFLGWGVSAPLELARSFWLPDALNNPFDTADQELVDLQQQALVADEETLAEVDQQIIARVAELGWFLPVHIQGESVLFDEEVVEVPWVDFQSVPTVTELRPAS